MTQLDRRVLWTRIVEEYEIPQTVNIAMPSANTEYNYNLPVWTRRFSFKLRNWDNTAKINLWTTPWLSWTDYITLPINSIYYEENLAVWESVYLYFQSDTSSNVAEIIIWL